MTLSDKQFGEMHRKLLANGGFSANSQTGKEPSAGYMVSIPGHEQQHTTADVTPGHLRSFAETNAAPLVGDDRYIGGWDSKGTTSLDVSQNIQPDKNVKREYGEQVALADARTSTLDLAYGRNQEAAYDLQSGDDLVNDHFDPSRRDARL